MISTDAIVADAAELNPSTIPHEDGVAVETSAVRRAPRRLPIEIIGLIGVLAVFFGISSMYSMQQPPFYETDEIAHVSYAREIADFRLPEVTTPDRVPPDLREYYAEYSVRQAQRYRTVWVANHPPLNYIIAAPAIWISDALGHDDGGLLMLRLQNVSFATLGVLLTYFLAREVTRNKRIALSASAVAALLPQAHVLFSRGLNDGLGFAAGTAVIWATVRCTRRSATRRDDVWLGVAAAVGCGARAATMLMAVALVGIVVLRRLAISDGPWKQRLWAAVKVGLIGIGPGVVTWGWFYVRNIALYGDIGASDYLLNRFERSGRGSLVDVYTTGWRWVIMMRRMASNSPLSREVPRFVTHVAVVTLVGVAIAVVVAAVKKRSDYLRGLAICFAAFAVCSLTVAHHIAGGGTPFARYFFPVIAVLAVLISIGFDRVAPRIGPLVLIATMAWWAISQMPLSVDPNKIRIRTSIPYPTPLDLRVLPGSPGARRLAAALITIGGAVAIFVLLRTAWPRVRSLVDGPASTERVSAGEGTGEILDDQSVGQLTPAGAALASAAD